MTDSSIREAFRKMQRQVYALAAEKGWHPDGRADTPDKIADYVPRAVANLHGEMSELWEAYRAGKLYEPCDKADRMEEPLTCLEEELADIGIRLMDGAEKLGVDLGRAIAIKHSYNSVRPHRHGGKLA
jgi:NTP pyrophosphatase (non-canonical NTP hydrolase)